MSQIQLPCVRIREMTKRKYLDKRRRKPINVRLEG